MTQKIEISKKVNLKDYDSISIGQYIETPIGDFVCKSKPNILQPIDSRFWVFEQVSGQDGEPLTEGQTVRVDSK